MSFAASAGLISETTGRNPMTTSTGYLTQDANLARLEELRRSAGRRLRARATPLRKASRSSRRLRLHLRTA